ncbi:MAG: peptidoglycan DD-metalloendopeptidase family protein [Oceanihabitans sp.]
MDSKAFTVFLNQISTSPISVLHPDIPLNKYVAIDLSSANSSLDSFDISSANAWENYLQNFLEKNNKTVAFGGYLEKRNLYQRSDYFNTATSQNSRNIHLGIDLWLPANSGVFTPFDAVVHSFKNNTNFGDYGPTIILKHQIDEVDFFTLYGHLSLKSISSLKVGQSFKAGQEIATLGDASVNGNYAPHLHFQIIRNMQGNYGDYPGVCSVDTLADYKENCPNPNTILKLY